MPYICKLNNGRYNLTKKSDGKLMGTHDSRKECIAQMRALYSSEVRNEMTIKYKGYVDFDADLKIANSVNEIHVVIDTSGGDYLEALSFHNKLRSSGKKVITHIDPWAFSAGAVVALAGDEIYMVENGVLMFHPPMHKSDEAKNSEELSHSVEVLKKMEATLINTLMSKTKKSEEECRNIVMNDTWMTADEALASGIINEIIPINREVVIENFFPDKIVNFLKEKEDMPLKELCDKFGVTDEDGLVKMINDLKENQKPKPSVIAPSIVNMVKKARKSELDSLVASGKAIPAVTNELVVKFLNDERVTADLQTENPEFDNIVAALTKNEEVMSFKGKSGTQILNKEETKEEVGALTQNAQKRIEEEKNRRVF